MCFQPPLSPAIVLQAANGDPLFWRSVFTSCSVAVGSSCSISHHHEKYQGMLRAACCLQVPGWDPWRLRTAGGVTAVAEHRELQWECLLVCTSWLAEAQPQRCGNHTHSTMWEIVNDAVSQNVNLCTRDCILQQDPSTWHPPSSWWLLTQPANPVLALSWVSTTGVSYRCPTAFWQWTAAHIGHQNPYRTITEPFRLEKNSEITWSYMAPQPMPHCLNTLPLHHCTVLDIDCKAIQTTLR